MTLIYILLIFVGLMISAISIASLISIKKRKNSGEITYGIGADKHILQTGIFIEHGMVIKDDKLQAQSKSLLVR